MTPARKPGDDRDPDDKASEGFGLRLGSWLDDRLEGPDEDLLRKELRDDPEKAKEARELELVVQTLRRLTPEHAPKDLLKSVQRRIRRRSHGRHFHANWRQRLPFEALLNGLLLLALVAFYVWQMPQASHTLAPVSPKLFQGAGSGTGLASSVLSYYGTIVGEAVEPGGGAVTLAVEVPKASLDALSREIALYYPLLIIDGETVPGKKPDTRIARVRAERPAQ